jgi:hypothetical protein
LPIEQKEPFLIELITKALRCKRRSHSLSR